MRGALRRLTRIALACALAPALLSCDFLLASAPGENGSGMTIGSVTGFGSVIVDGVTYDDTQGQINIEEDPSHPLAVATGNLKLGQQIRVVRPAANAIGTATVAAELIGPIDAGSITASGFSILGQSVLVNAAAAVPTVFEGVTGLAGLLPGKRVEVHGQRDPAGNVLASRVERREAGDTVIRLSGTATQVDTSAQTFVIASPAGAQTVSYQGATLVPSGQAPANGMRVEVFGNTVPAAGGTLQALALRSGTTLPADGSDVRVGGTVNQYASPSSFQVEGVVADASSAAVTGGTLADVRAGSVVRLHGVMMGGILRVADLTVVGASDVQAQLTGAVTGFFAPGGAFRVRGALVQLTQATGYAGGTLANVGDGVVVTVNGQVSGGAVQASNVQVVGSGSAAFLPVLVGPIAGLDAAAGSFGLAGVTPTVRFGASTRYVNGTAADLADNRDVRVRGGMSGGELAAAVVEFLDNSSSAPQTNIVGVAYNVVVNGSTGSFSVDEAQITFNAQTLMSPQGVLLDDGDPVTVVASSNGGVLVASSIFIWQPPAAGAVTVQGFVQDFVSQASFMVCDQRIDASGAAITQLDPQVSLGNGVFVDVTGSIADGVLTATQLTVHSAAAGGGRGE